jgi:predicted MFS family arabinose efflux permease
MTETPATSKADQRALLVTYVNIVLYALSYQLQRPVEPFLVEKLTAGGGDDAAAAATYYGILQSFFSAVQTVGSPAVGILLDRWGIRAASSVVFAASASSYAVLAAATDLRLLFASKVPTALQHAFLVAQAAAAACCSRPGDDAARAQALGRVTTAYTVGATLGPALGGWLADRGDLYAGAKLSVLLSLVSVGLSLLFLPNAARPTGQDKIRKKPSFADELRRSGEIAARSALWPLLLVKVVSGVSSSMQSTALPLVLTQDLKFDPAQLGLVMSSSMFAVGALGAVGMAPLTRRLGAAGTSRAGLVLRMGLVLVMSAIVSKGGTGDSMQKQIMTVSVLHGLASHALATGLTTQTTGVVSAEEQGALLGLEHGLFSLARIGGPPLGTALLAHGFWSVAAACSVTDLALLVVLLVAAAKARKSKAN